MQCHILCSDILHSIIIIFCRLLRIRTSFWKCKTL